MKSQKEIEQACMMFEQAAKKHAEATEMGDYGEANKNYKIIVKTAHLLKETDNMDKIARLLNNKSVGVRLWTATYHLPVSESDAIQILQQIADEDGIHALTAKTTIDEWKKRKLVL